ncbi:3-isopropylmalate dehydratase large subunit [Desulfosporosinus sp. I2]|uniref:3-isopropylmalate dehydratase large subunit n=1 Tax=Desulfosporosinus sp. I2 TaxID=1617025 RepID=UPI0005EE3F35|nr:3-isopropylmalate dehydratase large subunit [Desulfosporosinus sp. I2]KJR44664.1 3-isopropylmalate dehydratase large subunit [Desulfosporosinus sp. I2]
MAMTMTEKILAAHAGLSEVHPGQIINAKVDLVLANELSAIVAIEEFSKIKGAKNVFDPHKIVIIPDHFTPNKDIQSAKVAKKVREFALEHNTLYYEVGRMGIEHVLLPEQGLVRPGQLVIGGDSHTCTYGALGMVATGVGSTDIAVAWALGEVWLKVPPTIRIEFKGKKKPWVSGKDMILYMIGRLGVDGAIYSAIEFCGEGIAELSIAERLTMANMVIEAGAKNGVFAVDAKTEAYVKAATNQPYTVYTSDPDAEYAQTIVYDMDDIEPQVAFPHLPSNTKPISQVGDVTINQVVIGSCTNGRIEDLRIAAGLLKGKKIHPRVRCIIIPGTQKVYLDAMKEGLLETFIQAECVVSTPTCGPCVGGHMGILADGERCVSTTNRNFVGRMGHVTSEIYLASPAVAAATALRGKLADPGQL